MDPFRPKKNKKTGPERKIQDAIIAMLKMHDWFVKETHGNMYQSGFPDLWACHKSYGHRWVEVKNAESYSFTPAQLHDFPIFGAKGSGVWILVAATEKEYKKLFETQNWWKYLGLWQERVGRK